MTGDDVACRLLEVLVADMRPRLSESTPLTAVGLPAEPVSGPSEVVSDPRDR